MLSPDVALLIDWFSDWTAYGMYKKGHDLLFIFFVIGTPASIVAVMLTIVGIMFAPLSAWAELCHHQRRFKTSIHQAAVAAVRASMLLLPYWLSGSIGSGSVEFRRLLVWCYGFTYTVWFFGVTLLWLYNFRNIGYGEILITISEFESLGYFTAPMFSQRTHEEVATLIALVAVLLTCLYSIIYTWRMDHVEQRISDGLGQEHRNTYSIAPFAWTVAWLWLGIADHVETTWWVIQLEFPFYYLALPFAVASAAWIVVTGRNWTHREMVLRKMKTGDALSQHDPDVCSLQK